ncbi:DUF1707 SHOCT-like domain-containing protein [Nocardiopsis changdeensis]|uniref:DUF1707 and DUF2154 domain-containing protein n=1 Tax=Nocardiopsis changdeensis TaxID=2831969 RepID=A0ABX8BHP7_9ACTN|nr:MULTISPECIES: DUF1707 domain-containing protein [Nocardiopsis]QUX21754.1 DUF1707 and DUF2154 domain-containing protein [Nocardiopsis changdeensis]QYX37689.1 DUF1707 domain-containing protein [Nocardiopsis sp. MT53]
MVETMSEITPPDPGRMRASDADRDAVAHRLQEAFAEGRLDPDEHSERLDAVYRAKTLGELVPLTEDLPAAPGPAAAPAAPGGFRSPRPVYGADRVVDQAPTSHSAIAVMGGADRSGNWVLPENFFSFALMGGIELDLREARFTARETTIWTTAVMGGIGIIVPDDIQVRVHGLPIMGGFGVEEGTPSVLDPGTPVVHIRGLAVMGGVGIEYRKRKHQKRQDEIEE